MADTCGNSNLNPSVACEQLDGQYKKAFLLKEGFSFSTQTLAKTKSEWETAIQSGDVIPFPDFHSIEPQNSGAVYDSTSLGDIPVSNGTISWLAKFKANYEMYQKLESYSGATTHTLVFATASGKLKMYKDPTSGVLSGFGLKVLNIENPDDNDGSVAEKAPVKITLDDIVEMRSYSLVFKPLFNPARLKALNDITLEVVSASATTITFKAYRASSNEDVQLANPQYGLVAADFSLKTTAGAEQSIASVSGGDVAASGLYTLSGTGLVTGTLDCVDPSLMTTTGLSNVAAVTVTIA